MHTQTAELLNIDTRRKNKESVSSCELGVSAKKKTHTHTTLIRFTLYTLLKADKLAQVCVCVCVWRGGGQPFGTLSHVSSDDKLVFNMGSDVRWFTVSQHATNFPLLSQRVCAGQK